MAIHLIVGAGSVGSATAVLLADQGEEVRLVSRSGHGPADPRIQKVPLDANDRAAVLGTAIGVGASLLTVGNLYVYGPVGHPIRESDPLVPAGRKGAIRAQMWTDALAAHAAGKLKVTEVRSSDYFGPGVIDTS